MATVFIFNHKTIADVSFLFVYKIIPTLIQLNSRTKQNSEKIDKNKQGDLPNV